MTARSESKSSMTIELSLEDADRGLSLLEEVARTAFGDEARNNGT